jgi:hypothetical protein
MHNPTINDPYVIVSTFRYEQKPERREPIPPFSSLALRAYKAWKRDGTQRNVLKMQ